WFRHQDSYGPILEPAEAVKAERVVLETPLRLFGDLDFGNKLADGRVPAGKINAGRFADLAAPAIASHEIFCPQRRAVRQRDVDAGLILREIRDRAPAMDRHAEFANPISQQALDMVLPQREPIIVPGWKVADVERI